MEGNSNRWATVQADVGEANSSEWRSQLQGEARQRVVNKIMHMLKKHLPISGPEGLAELKKIAVRLEEKMYTSATTQSDYLRKISEKILKMEQKTQGGGVNGNPLSSTSSAANQNSSDRANLMQPQVRNQGSSMQVPVPNQPQTRQQHLAQNLQSNISSTTVQGNGGRSPALSSITGLTQPNMSRLARNSVNNTPGQSVPQNIYANSQRQMQGRHQQQSMISQQHQQQSLVRQQQSLVRRQQSSQQPKLHQQTSSLMQQPTSISQQSAVLPSHQQQIMGHQLLGKHNNISDLQQQHQLHQRQQHQRLSNKQNGLMSIQQNTSLLQQQQMPPQSSVSGMQQQPSLQERHRLHYRSTIPASNMQPQNPMHILQHSEAAGQHMQQTSPVLLQLQGQQTQVQSSQQQPMPQLQTEAQLQQQMGLQQVHQRLQAPGSFFQSQITTEQKPQFQSQRLLPEAPSTYVDSTGQTSEPVPVWQEEIYQKIISMKELYYPELHHLSQMLGVKLQKDHLPPPSGSKQAEHLENMKKFRNVLDHMLQMLLTPRNTIPLAMKDKIPFYEKQIISMIANISRRAVPLQPQGQQQLQHSGGQNLAMPQPPSLVPQLQQADSQLNQISQMSSQATSTSMNSTGMSSMQSGSLPLSTQTGVPTTQQNIMSSLQSGSNIESGNALSSAQKAAISSLQVGGLGTLQQTSIAAAHQNNVNNLMQKNNANPLQCNALQHQVKQGQQQHQHQQLVMQKRMQQQLIQQNLRQQQPQHHQQLQQQKQQPQHHQQLQQQQKQQPQHHQQLQQQQKQQPQHHQQLQQQKQQPQHHQQLQQQQKQQPQHHQQLQQQKQQPQHHQQLQQQKQQPQHHQQLQQQKQQPQHHQQLQQQQKQQPQHHQQLQQQKQQPQHHQQLQQQKQQPQHHQQLQQQQKQQPQHHQQLQQQKQQPQHHQQLQRQQKQQPQHHQLLQQQKQQPQHHQQLQQQQKQQPQHHQQLQQQQKQQPQHHQQLQQQQKQQPQHHQQLQQQKQQPQHHQQLQQQKQQPQHHQQLQQQHKQQLNVQRQGSQMQQLHPIDEMNELDMRQISSIKPALFQPPYQIGQRQAYYQKQHKIPTPSQSVSSPAVDHCSPAPPTLPIEHEKQLSNMSSLPNTGNAGPQQSGPLPPQAQSLAVDTPGISVSSLLDGKPTVIERPLEHLLRVVGSLSPNLLASSASDIGSVVSMIDQISGLAPGNGSRAAVGEDLIGMQARNFMSQDGGGATKKMKRHISSMPLNVVSSSGSVHGSLKRTTSIDTRELESTATSRIKRHKMEANHALFEEIRFINQRLIDTSVDVTEEDVNYLSSTTEGEGTVVKFTYCAVTLCPTLQSQFAAARVSPVLPLRLLIPPNYPCCSPVLLDKIPVELSNESEDLSVKARSRFSSALHGLSSPMPLKEMARTWDVCARTVISEFAQLKGGGTFSSKYGKWETLPGRD